MIKAESTVTTMTCTECDVLCQRFGTHRNGLQRFVARSARSLHRTAQAPNRGYEPRRRKGLLALQLFVEGNSLRSTERITGVDINTLMKLLVRAGEKCEKVMGKLIVNIPVKDVQCDEIWAFVQKKEGNKAPLKRTTTASATPTALLPSSAIPSSF